MKIYSSRYEDLKKERDAWDENLAQSKKRYEEQQSSYDEAMHAVVNPIKAQIEADLSKFDLLDFQVKVGPTFNREDSLEIRVFCNQNRLFDETSALAWDYFVSLSNGQVKSESGSYSGLNATTPESLASLKQTVEALSYLNAQDWASILQKELPDYLEYVTEQVPYNRPDFESQIKEEELKEYIGQDIAFRGQPIEQLGMAARRNATQNFWYIIKRETPKKYFVTWFSDRLIRLANIPEDDPQAIINNFKNQAPQQIKKEILLDALYYPFETLK